MSKNRITNYLCRIKLGEPVFSSDLDMITVGDSAVAAKMRPIALSPGCRTARKITSFMQCTQMPDPYCLIDSGQLVWERGWIRVNDEEIALRDYVVIEITTPDHCQWDASILTADGAGGENQPVFSVYASQGGALPEDKDNVCGGGKLHQTTQTTNTLVPGDLLSLREFFSVRGKTYQHIGGQAWWGTCCFTGGTVISVDGDYGDPNLEYTANIQGRECICIPSDFVEYEVGDRIFVYVPGGYGCNECGRDYTCKDAVETAGLEQEIIYIILPLRINNYGA